jgi:hypothetical protein
MVSDDNPNIQSTTLKYEDSTNDQSEKMHCVEFLIKSVIKMYNVYTDSFYEFLTTLLDVLFNNPDITLKLDVKPIMHVLEDSMNNDYYGMFKDIYRCSLNCAILLGSKNMTMYKKAEQKLPTKYKYELERLYKLITK